MEKGKKRSRGCRELGGVGGHSVRGACAGHPRKAGRRRLCVAVATARCRWNCLRRRSLAGGAGRAGLSEPSTPPPRAALEQRSAAASSLLGPSHGDQSERGWLGGKPREAFIAARVAAQSCQDPLRVFQPNGLPHPSPGGTPPFGWSPACLAVLEEIKWSLGGHREVLSHTRLFHADLKHPFRPRQHTLSRRVV